MDLFYTPGILTGEVILQEEESRHISRVLRLRKGDPVYLVNGTGGFYKGEIADPDPRECKVRIIESVEGYKKHPYHLHIAIAPTKNTDRIEWFIEKATETGIDELSFLLCRHSERKVVNPERLRKVMISAMKQSQKAYLPKINGMNDFNQFTEHSFPGQKFIAHCKDSAEKPHLKELYKAQGDVLILIGPEGDFTSEEIELAKNNGFREISLGASRLRTETAALMACSVINIMN